MATIELNSFRSNFRYRVEQEMSDLRDHSGWLLGEGIALVMLGGLAIAVAAFSTLVSVVFLGWLLLVGGLFQIAAAFSTRRWSGFFAAVLIGTLYTVTGVLMLLNPAVAAASLTLFLAAFFMVAGAFRAVGALTLRHRQWGWPLVSGILTFVLGLMVWRQWPASALWVIGTFLGIEMIFFGCGKIAFASALRREYPRQAEKLAA